MRLLDQILTRDGVKKSTKLKYENANEMDLLNSMAAKETEHHSKEIERAPKYSKVNAWHLVCIS